MSVKRELKRVIVAGEGNLAFGMGIESNTKLPLLSICALPEPKEIGSDVLEEENEEILSIIFTDLKSLDVFEKMCQKVREVLESQIDVKPE